MFYINCETVLFLDIEDTLNDIQCRVHVTGVSRWNVRWKGKVKEGVLGWNDAWEECSLGNLRALECKMEGMYSMGFC